MDQSPQTGSYLDDLPEESRPQLAPPWEQVKDRFAQAFPDLDPEQSRQRYEQSRKLSAARSLQAHQEETWSSYLGHNAIPLVSSVGRAAEAASAGRAGQRLQAGSAEPGDYEKIAYQEQQQQRDVERNQTVLGKLGTAAVRAPAFVGEAVLGGALLKGVGAAAEAGAAVALPRLTLQNALPRAGAAVLQGLKSPAAWGRTAATTATVPGFWAERWMQNNLERRRDPLDVRGFPAAFGLGMVQTAILGSLQPQGAALMPGAGAANFAGRTALKGALGVGEQAGADVISGAGLALIKKVLPTLTPQETPYGTIGELIDGKGGDALKDVAVQFLTFAAFSALHEGQSGTPAQQRQAGLAKGLREFTGEVDEHLGQRRPSGLPIDTGLEGPERGLEPAQPVRADPQRLKDALDNIMEHLRRKGLTAEAAGRQIRDQVAQPLADLLASNPNPTREQVRELWKGFRDEDPMKDLGHAFSEVFFGRPRPEQAPEQKTPEPAPQPAQNAPEAAPQPTAPQGQPAATPKQGRLPAPEQRQLPAPRAAEQKLLSGPAPEAPAAPPIAAADQPPSAPAAQEPVRGRDTMIAQALGHHQDIPSDNPHDQGPGRLADQDAGPDSHSMLQTPLDNDVYPVNKQGERQQQQGVGWYQGASGPWVLYGELGEHGTPIATLQLGRKNWRGDYIDHEFKLQHLSGKTPGEVAAAIEDALAEQTGHRRVQQSQLTEALAKRHPELQESANARAAEKISKRQPKPQEKPAEPQVSHGDSPAQGKKPLTPEEQALTFKELQARAAELLGEPDLAEVPPHILDSLEKHGADLEPEHTAALKAVLQSGSLRGAAPITGVSHETVRKRAGKALAELKRRDPENWDRVELTKEGLAQLRQERANADSERVAADQDSGDKKHAAARAAAQVTPARRAGHGRDEIVDAAIDSGHLAKLDAALDEGDHDAAFGHLGELTPDELYEKLGDQRFHQQLEEEYNRVRTEARQAGVDDARAEETLRHGETDGAGGPPPAPEGAAPGPRRSWRDFVRSRKPAGKPAEPVSEDLPPEGPQAGKDFWAERARQAGMDPEDLHGQVKERRRQLKEDRARQSELLGEVEGQMGGHIARIRMGKAEDSSAVPGIDEAAQQLQRMVPGLFSDAENPSDTLFRLILKGLPKTEKLEESYRNTFNAMELEHARQAAERAGVSARSIAEALRSGQEAGERDAAEEAARDEDGGDTSFDFGANEPGPATEQKGLFGGSKFIGAQSDLFPTEKGGAPAEPKPVDERQQHLFGGPSEESPAGMGATSPPGSGQGRPPGPDAPHVGNEEVPDRQLQAPMPPSSWFTRAHDWLKSAAQQQFPSVTRLAPASGEKLAEAANAHAAARASWEYYSNLLKVGDTPISKMTPEERRLVGAIWVERRFRHYRKYLHDHGMDWAQVPTLVGALGSPLETEADYQDGHRALHFLWEAVKQEWTPEVEGYFKQARGMDDADDILSPTQIPGLPLNLIGMDEESPAQGVVGVGRKQGMGNQRIRRPAFMKRAGFDAEAYDLDIGHMMQRTLNLGLPAAKRAGAVRQLLADGLLEQVNRGQRHTPGFQELGLRPSEGLPGLESGASYYAEPDAYRDTVQGLGIGERPGQTLASGLKGLMDRVYSFTLMSPVDLFTHLGNHLTALFGPGMGIPGWNLKDSLSYAWRKWQGDHHVLDRLRQLAEIGAGFGSHESKPGMLESFLPEGPTRDRYGKFDPTRHFNRFTSGLIDLMQSAVRLQLEDAFDKMVKAGHFPDTQTARRDFINQALGNYNTQAGNRLVQFLKDTGLQSFATAAWTFTTQGIKTGLLSKINSPTTSWQSQVQLRMQFLAKLLPVLAAGPVLNYLRYGEAFPQDVPVFAIKTSDDQDKVSYWDQLKLTGLRRGWRATGVNAVIERAVQGDSNRNLLDHAKRDWWMSAEHLFAGPPAQFLHTAMTGENAVGKKVSEQVSKAKTVEGRAMAEAKGKKPAGSSQTWEDVKAALLGINPLIGSLTEKNKSTRSMLERLTQSVGPFGPTTREKSKKK